MKKAAAVFVALVSVAAFSAHAQGVPSFELAFATNPDTVTVPAVVWSQYPSVDLGVVTLTTGGGACYPTPISPTVSVGCFSVAGIYQVDLINSGSGYLYARAYFGWDGSNFYVPSSQPNIRLFSPESGSTTPQTTVVLSYGWNVGEATSTLFTGFDVRNLTTGFQYYPFEVTATTTVGSYSRTYVFGVGDRILWNAYIRDASSTIRVQDFPRVFSVVAPPSTTTNPFQSNLFSTTTYEDLQKTDTLVGLMSHKIPFDYVFLATSILLNPSYVATATPSFAMDLNLGATTTHVVLFSKDTILYYLPENTLVLFRSLIGAVLWVGWLYMIFHKVLNLI